MITGTSSPASATACTIRGASARCPALLHRQADHVGVLLLDRGDHGLGGLAQTQVDDLHAPVAQHAGHHFEAPVVAVEAEFGQHHPDRGFAAGRGCVLTLRHRQPCIP